MVQYYHKGKTFSIDVDGKNAEEAMKNLHERLDNMRKAELLGKVSSYIPIADGNTAGFIVFIIKLFKFPGNLLIRIIRELTK